MGKCLSKSKKDEGRNLIINLNCSSTFFCTCDKCSCCLIYKPQANMEAEELRHITGVWKVHSDDCRRCLDILAAAKINDKRYCRYDTNAGILWITGVMDMKGIDMMVKKHLGIKKETSPSVTMKVELNDTSLPVIVETVCYSKEFKGFEKMQIDEDNNIITIRGEMDMKRIAKVLQDRLRTNVEIVPSNDADEAAV